jgi:RNA recognition motif-containing protein
MDFASDHLRTLFLGNLSFKCHEHDILRIFSPFGKIQSIRFIKNKQTNVMIGYGFITFESREAAVLAVREMNGQILLGRELRYILIGCLSSFFGVHCSQSWSC